METDNIYIKFVSKYSNDELLKSIENPDDYGKDVYNAILSVSLNRELISKEQFDDLLWPEIKVESEIAKTEEEVISVNNEDFWKCPKCGQTVENNFDACWNCQTDKPQKFEHPTTTEIIEYQIDKKPFNFIRTGFITIGSGILILVLSYSLTLSDYFGFHYLPLGKFLYGIIIIGIGILILLKGFLRKKKE